jgi:hypothetical protein
MMEVSMVMAMVTKTVETIMDQETDLPTKAMKMEISMVTPTVE